MPGTALAEASAISVRVTKPGGMLLIANHFSFENGLRGILEMKMPKRAAKLGWRRGFPVSTALCSQ